MVSQAANSTQIGGKHYKTNYEHWDLVVDVGMGYFEGQITRYIARWRKKDGLQDLQKAVHYIDKLIEVRAKYRRPITSGISVSEVAMLVVRFAKANSLTEGERSAILDIASWETVDDLYSARTTIQMLIETTWSKPVPATDSNKHADRS